MLRYYYSKFFKKILRGKSILNSKVDKSAKIYSGTEFYDSSIGRYSYIGYDCEIHSCDIGAFCSIANGLIVGGARHPLNWVSTSPVFYNVSGGTNVHLGSIDVEPVSRTIIGHDVWVGSRAIIMQGVSIGNGAVVGAGAVVTKDIPPYAIVGGCPAKVIKFRFNEEIIAKLQASEWWMLSDEKLLEISCYINEPLKFLAKINSIK